MKRLLISACILLLFGCARVDQDSYDRIKTGMTTDEVAAILGKPSATNGGGVSAVGVSLSELTQTWESSGRKITATFVNGKLLAKTKEGF